MQLSEQKELGLRLLAELNEWRPTILAGGAPRDWGLGKKANDLDFFILEDFDYIEIEGNLGVELSLEGKEGISAYEGMPFEVWTGYYGEQKVQFIRHRHTSTAKEVINGFGCSLSKIWYDTEGELQKSDQYVIARTLGIAVLSVNVTGSYMNKCQRILQENNILYRMSSKSVLKSIGEGAHKNRNTDTVAGLRWINPPHVDWGQPIIAAADFF